MLIQLMVEPLTFFFFFFFLAALVYVGQERARIYMPLQAGISLPLGRNGLSPLGGSCLSCRISAYSAVYCILLHICTIFII